MNGFNCHSYDIICSLNPGRYYDLPGSIYPESVFIFEYDGISQLALREETVFKIRQGHLREQRPLSSCAYSRSQICRFCWNKIRTEGSGLCPACRSPYAENPADFKPLTAEEMARIKAEKRQKDAARKQKVSENR